ncbi:hypothetical protein [Cellulomonas taurus]|uniref:hypothetical protein n=1 Tax=Cellulomonas taurus TaxID=2729175 RepID=UPI00145C6205|nr:hypothetical protein [Cellulomonas taurus]
MSQPDIYDLLDQDPTVPVVELTDTDLGVVATVTWPRLRGTGHTTPGKRPYATAWPERVHVTRLADLIREHCPTAEVWWPTGCEYLAIRQDARDVVAYPGDTLVIAAGEVTRTTTQERDQ